MGGRDDALIEEMVSAPARPEALEALHALFARFWAALDAHQLAVPAMQRHRFATAVIETGGNVIRYAYPDGEPGRLELHLRARREALEARYIDRGVRYEAQAPAPVALEDLPIAALPEGGYGLALTLSAVDRLDYERTPDGHNHWTLISYVRP